MKTKDLLDILEKYCDKIIRGGKHYKCFVKGTNKIITVSSTSSDFKFYSMVYRDFRRIGIIIDELNK